MKAETYPKRISRPIYEEALETYNDIQPVVWNKRFVFYDLSDDDWEHLLYMAQCHLDGQAMGADEQEQRAKCRRYSRQIDFIRRSTIFKMKRL